jgi:signal transduction histidine kinase
MSFPLPYHESKARERTVSNVLSVLPYGTYREPESMFRGMGIPVDQIISTCVHFGRMISEAHDPEKILPLLADAAVEQLRVDGALVLRVGEGEFLQVAASRGIPAESCSDQFSVETIGREMEQQLLASGGHQFAEVRTLPLVSSTNLYGALVLFFREPGLFVDTRQKLARGVADLAAVALDQAFHRQTLESSLEELRSTRELLARTERLRALGELSTSIAHDLRNIFNPLSLQIDLVRRAAQKPEKVLELADQMKQVVKRGTETVERLRLFGHQSREVATEVADLDVLVDEAAALCRPRLGENSRVFLEVVHGGPLKVQVRGAEVVTALVNLIVNAQEALPLEGGAITVRTGTSSEDGWLQVADTGMGMPPEVKQRLFEPFFTTKGEKGTGLGLAMVDTFVRRSGGAITVDSEPGKGTTFTLRFPLVR